MLCHWVCWVFADSGETVRLGMSGLTFFPGAFLWLPVPPFSAFLYRVGFSPCPFAVPLQLSTTVPTWILHFWPYSHVMQTPAYCIFSYPSLTLSLSVFELGSLWQFVLALAIRARLYPEHSVNTMFLEQGFHIYQKGHVIRIWGFGLGFLPLLRMSS